MIKILKTPKLVEQIQADLKYAGWTLFKNAAPRAMYSELRDEVKETTTGWIPLFGHAKKGSKSAVKDKRRLELPLDDTFTAGKCKATQAWLNFLPEFAHTLCDGHFTLGKKSALQSLIDAMAQHPHSDFAKKQLAKISGLHSLPYIFCWALTRDCALTVWSGVFLGDDHCVPTDPVTIFYQPGDVLMFRGDLIHAGPPANEYSARGHAYVLNANLQDSGVAEHVTNNITELVEYGPWEDVKYVDGQPIANQPASRHLINLRKKFPYASATRRVTRAAMSLRRSRFTWQDVSRKVNLTIRFAMLPFIGRLFKPLPESERNPDAVERKSVPSISQKGTFLRPNRNPPSLPFTSLGIQPGQF
jgi:hypothetical protein